MLDGFAGLWTPVVFARELRSKPVAVRVAGEKFALFRDANGTPRALVDRCPHRGVALSLGRVTPDGCLECPFHGWKFSGDGACQHIPYNGDLPEAKRARLGATSFPVIEQGGLIWLYTAPSAETPAPPSFSPAIVDPSLARWQRVKRWSTHWTRAMENMLDVPHLPFVHRNTIGMGMRRTLQPSSKMELNVQETPFGFILNMVTDGVPGRLDWYRPNGMVLHLEFGKRKTTQHIWCVPVDANTTDMMIVSTRDFGHYNPFFWLFDMFNLRILLEDERVLVSSDPPEVPNPSLEKSVPTDMPTLRFRSWYLNHKREEGRQAEGSQFAA